jgi:oligopeptide transport system substrate-binding protein
MASEGYESMRFRKGWPFWHLSVLILIGVWFAVGAVGSALGGVLHRGNGTEPETLDIHKSSGEGEGWIQMDVFEGLMTVDAKGTIIPGVAESWTVSDDGLTYVFRLRGDARWSDGSPVTAEDFVFAWKRLLSPDLASRYAFFLWPVHNAKSIARGELAADRLGVKALDPRTLQITLEVPTAYFLSALQHPATYPLHRASVARYGSDYVRPGHLISNGAFALAESVPQSHVKLIKNPFFHSAAQVKLDAVYYYPTENKETEMKRFRSGELHVSYDIPDALVPWAKENLPEATRLSPYFSTYYFSFNLRHEPWRSNPDLRAALSLAIDRRMIVDKVTQAGELPAFTLVPPGTQNYNSPQPAWANWTQDQRDAKALELIKKAGYGPEGKPLQVEILYNTSENHRKLAIAVESMWRQKLGVKGILSNQEWKVLLSSRAQGQFRDIVRSGWIGDFNDAYSFLAIFLSDVGGSNHPGYISDAYDKLMQDAARERDQMKRAALLRKAETILIEDHAIIPIYTYVSSHMVSPKVQGWEDNVRDFHLSRYLSVLP